MIKTTTKALEYLSLHDSGEINDLKKKVAKDQIDLMKRSGALSELGKKYKFTARGKEIYAVDYASKETGFLRL